MRKALSFLEITYNWKNISLSNSIIYWWLQYNDSGLFFFLKKKLQQMFFFVVKKLPKNGWNSKWIEDQNVKKWQWIEENIPERKKNKKNCTQLIVSYSPQQNSVYEWKNRTMVEMAKCMLFEKKLPKHLWVEVVDIVVYLLSRLKMKHVQAFKYHLLALLISTLWYSVIKFSQRFYSVTTSKGMKFQVPTLNLNWETYEFWKSQFPSSLCANTLYRQ